MTKIVEIRNLYPTIKDGTIPIKREVDRPLEVSVEIFTREDIKCSLLWRKVEQAEGDWSSVPMSWAQGARWEAILPLSECGSYLFTVEATTSQETFRAGIVQELWIGVSKSRFASWYELFPRSQGTQKGKHGTFKDVEARLSDIKQMGFDVIYFPPICPIGLTNRKGKNNSLSAQPGEPGTPWSVGNEHGGHADIHPELGSEADFKHLIAKMAEYGIELALDFTSNCSPDHPWIQEHPSWFFYNPDGTVKYAENPPKKYQDVCPLNFDIEDKEELYQAILEIFLVWVKRGVKIFRIDNPHTKPTEFWGWLIREVRQFCPQAVFLAEAFTNYDKLEELAGCGFTQSYCYFTWRNKKNELLEYFLKLTGSYLSEFLRVNLFTNTPDILPEYLQTGGKNAFRIRYLLAATLSSVCGIYSGFELLENEPLVPGKESYLDSEKYEIKPRDWDRPGNIKSYIAQVNKIRRDNPALHYYDNLCFFNSTDDNIICHGKVSPDRENIIVCAVNLDPFSIHSGRITLPLEKFGIGSNEPYRALNLLDASEEIWKGREQNIDIDPEESPGFLWKIIRKPIEV